MEEWKNIPRVSFLPEPGGWSHSLTLCPHRGEGCLLEESVWRVVTASLRLWASVAEVVVIWHVSVVAGRAVFGRSLR